MNNNSQNYSYMDQPGSSNHYLIQQGYAPQQPMNYHQMTQDPQNFVDSNGQYVCSNSLIIGSTDPNMGYTGGASSPFIPTQNYTPMNTMVNSEGIVYEVDGPYQKPQSLPPISEIGIPNPSADNFGQYSPISTTSADESFGLFNKESLLDNYYHNLSPKQPKTIRKSRPKRQAAMKAAAKNVQDDETPKRGRKRAEDKNEEQKDPNKNKYMQEYTAKKKRNLELLEELATLQDQYINGRCKNQKETLRKISEIKVILKNKDNLRANSKLHLL